MIRHREFNELVVIVGVLQTANGETLHACSLDQKPGAECREYETDLSELTADGGWEELQRAVQKARVATN